MASLDDILSTQKNGVIAINNLAGWLSKISGDFDLAIDGANFPSSISPTIAASTTSQIYVGSGKVFSVSIPVHSGSGQMFLYDSATVGGISTANCIFACLPSNASSFTPYQDVRLPFSNGLVLKTDAGVNACVGYTKN